MFLSTSELANYTGHIDKILAGADLSTVSVKKVRNQLDLTGLDIDADTKKALNNLIEQRFDVAIAAQDPVKEEDESDEEDEQPQKKRVKREKEKGGDDAELAAMLQAEENRSSRITRATRGSGKGTSAKASKNVKKAEKKTRKKKVVEPEYDSDGNEIVKKKNGAFNKEWALSEPLSILVGGATQMSRPQTVKKIWEHIKANDLQVPTDKRQIICDDKMRAVFKCDQIHMFTMNKLLGKHFYPTDDDAEGLVSTKEKEQKVGSDGKKSTVRVKDESEEEAEADEVAEEAMHMPESTQESYKEESKESSEEPSTKDVSEAPEKKEETPSSEEN